MQEKLTAILRAKEEKAEKQKSLKKTPKARCILSMGVNMPGDNKLCEDAKLFFHSGQILVFRTFANQTLKLLSCNNESGYCLMLALKTKPETAKKKAVKIEESYPWTRMLDLDIIPYDSEASLSRTSPRKCLVCDKPAFECSRSKTHSREEIFAKIDELKRDCMAFRCAELATSSLMTELETTPKPGLVDRENNGSHKDLNFNLMSKSANTLRPWFYKIAKAKDFKTIREIGKKAERAMLKSTNGVNTHKGAVFMMGILCFCSMKTESLTPAELCKEIKKQCKGISQELGETASTHGEVCFRNFKALGARGMAENGYSILVDKALPKLKEELEVKKTDLNLALLRTLMVIVANTDDTNILYRSNEQTLVWAKNTCESLANGNLEDFYRLDKAFIEKNISPGGSADLLAGTWFLYNLSLVAQAPDC